MRTSELIQKLKDIEAVHGDLPVIFEYRSEWEPAFMEGYDPSKDDDYIPTIGIKSLVVSDHRWDKQKLVKLTLL